MSKGRREQELSYYSVCPGDSNSQERGGEACISHILMSSFICNNAGILAAKESTCNAGDPGSIPKSGISTGGGIGYPLQCSWACLVAQLVKNLPAMQETLVQFLSQEYPLEEG